MWKIQEVETNIPKIALSFLMVEKSYLYRKNKKYLWVKNFNCLDMTILITKNKGAKYNQNPVPLGR